LSHFDQHLLPLELQALIFLREALHGLLVLYEIRLDPLESLLALPVKWNVPSKVEVFKYFLGPLLAAQDLHKDLHLAFLGKLLHLDAEITGGPYVSFLVLDVQHNALVHLGIR
jgi:hypothetical protein